MQASVLEKSNSVHKRDLLISSTGKFGLTPRLSSTFTKKLIYLTTEQIRYFVQIIDIKKSLR